jgi:acetyltransferase
VATCQAEDGQEQVIGVIEWHRCEAAQGGAEFALAVADGWQRLGIGRRLVSAMLRCSSATPLRWLVADVLMNNTAMLALMDQCGFCCAEVPDQGGVLRVSRLIHAAETAPRAPLAAAAWGWLCRLSLSRLSEVWA